MQLEADLLFLLPSAFNNEAGADGKVHRHYSGLFSQRVFELRNKLLIAPTGADKSGGGHTKSQQFNTLGEWLQHANTVWKALEMSGPTLLYYKTIQEIQLRNILDEVVIQVQNEVVSGENGFYTQAKAIMKRHREALDG